jgi:protein-L-isoaspartate(D-aspartate) O-methyltransferase
MTAPQRPRPRFPLQLDGLGSGAGGKTPLLRPQQPLQQAAVDSARVVKPSGLGLDSVDVRQRMVSRLQAAGLRDELVIAAMNKVPRHLFVDTALATQAYEDTSLPIGLGQTISKPSVVARMIELLMAGANAKTKRALGQTLEIGTGCGYQAAVLAQLFPQVYSIERIKGLLERARANLLGLRLANLRLAHGDGYAGLEEAAPFQSIVVAAAARQVPQALLRQLAPGGRMILPLHEGKGQRLVLIERGARGFAESELDAVRFVPMEMGKA